MKNAINNQVGMLGDMFLWLVANLKQGVIYFIKQACGNDILASVYMLFSCSWCEFIKNLAEMCFTMGARVLLLTYYIGVQTTFPVVYTTYFLIYRVM